MKQGACYIRVSTDDQLEYSPDAQLREIQKYAKSNDILISKEHIFIDEGITGRSAKKRPGFNKMIGTAKQDPRPFDVILLWKFSRFARNQEESIVYKSLLRRQGVEIISVSEPLAEGPFGTLIERIIEWMDEYYSIRLSGEVTRGMTEKALRGGFQTGAPFGYVSAGGKTPLIFTNRKPSGFAICSSALLITVASTKSPRNLTPRESKPKKAIFSKTVPSSISSTIQYTLATCAGPPPGRLSESASMMIPIPSSRKANTLQLYLRNCGINVRKLYRAGRQPESHMRGRRKQRSTGLSGC